MSAEEVLFLVDWLNRLHVEGSLGSASSSHDEGSLGSASSSMVCRPWTVLSGLYLFAGCGNPADTFVTRESTAGSVEFGRFSSASKAANSTACFGVDPTVGGGE